VQLQRWGLLDQAVSDGAPPIRSVLFERYDAELAALRLTVKEKAGVDHMLAPRRYSLDDILVSAAVHAGATLLDRTTCKGVLRDSSGRVCGVVVVRADGSREELRSSWVVGADGVRSRMAGLLGAETIEAYEPSGSCFYTYVDGVDWDGFEFHLGDNAFAGVFPTNDDAACVWLMQPHRAPGALLTADTSRVVAWVATLEEKVPRLASRVRSGNVRGRLRGSVGLPNHVRQAWGAGWALVGDAGYHRDPITGHGITDAFRDAELLAEALDGALCDAANADGWLAQYQATRDAAIAEIFALTRALGAFPASEQFAALQAELSRALEAEAQWLAERTRVDAMSSSTRRRALC
jgi:2-polyprenyl-6-methoxyphenol hydroxylase-like FAD-dependent oxidoreductase